MVELKNLRARTQLSLLLIIACGIGLPIVPLQSTAEEETGHIRKFLQGLETLQVNFRQTLHNEQGEKLETSNGVLYLQRPGKFHWSYEDPYKQQIITDGETLWIYDEDLEQVTIRDISGSMKQTPASIIVGDENVEDYFVMIDMGEIEGFDWVEFTPRDVEAQYSSIRFGFDQDNLGMMVIYDNLGQVTRIDFSDHLRNKQLDTTLFSFEPPADVDVIDDRG
jgi:outer membrane lipoprotein carrier protein